MELEGKNSKWAERGMPWNMVDEDVRFIEHCKFKRRIFKISLVKKWFEIYCHWAKRVPTVAYMDRDCIRDSSKGQLRWKDKEGFQGKNFKNKYSYYILCYKLSLKGSCRFIEQGTPSRAIFFFLIKKNTWILLGTFVDQCNLEPSCNTFVFF